MVVVTGGTAGIGRAVSTAFAREGARVVLCGRQASRGLAVEELLREAGLEARFIQADVSSRADTERLIESAVREHGRLDVVVNNAAVFSYGVLEDVSEDEWDRVIDTNLKSVYLVSKAAIPHIRASGGGSIVNVSSVHAIATADHVAVYAASKGGVLALSRQMALDLAADRIRVNALIVGSVDTDMSREHAKSAGVAASTIGLQADDRSVGRMAGTSEVANAVLFLASPDASFVNGSSMVVDGALLARLGTH